MTYKAKAAVCSEIIKKTQGKQAKQSKFRMLNLVVRKETARL
jgi:hypothetical protein